MNVAAVNHNELINKNPFKQVKQAPKKQRPVREFNVKGNSSDLNETNPYAKNLANPPVPVFQQPSKNAPSPFNSEYGQPGMVAQHMNNVNVNHLVSVEGISRK